MSVPRRAPRTSAKRSTPAELAEVFKSEQARMKQEAADRRSAAEERRAADTAKRSRPARRS